jgi:succinate-semialdehyde dehydrogenase/glutarate-semialdehyde dehydrogenase
VFKVITGSSRELGPELTGNVKVRKLTFTGSTEVGRELLRQCADTVKKTSMEPGGNAPFIMLADASLDQAVHGAIASKFRNAGQTCACTNSILVDRSILEPFVTKLGEAMRALQVGDGREGNTVIGPLIDRTALDKVNELLSMRSAKTSISLPWWWAWANTWVCSRRRYSGQWLQSRCSTLTKRHCGSLTTPSLG